MDKQKKHTQNKIILRLIKMLILWFLYLQCNIIVIWLFFSFEVSYYVKYRDTKEVLIDILFHVILSNKI